MTASQTDILEKVRDLLGEHFSAFAVSVTYEDDNGAVESCHVHHGNFYEVLGLADANIQALRSELTDR